MIWLTWRQHRAVLTTSAAVATALVVWMLLAEHDYLAGIHAMARSCPLDWENTHGTLLDTCNSLFGGLTSAREQALIIFLLVLALPVVLGALLGAPLIAGELERKTVILAFTQGISRTRWTVTRWLFVGLAVVTITSAVVGIWSWVSGQVGPEWPAFAAGRDPGVFDVNGIVPVAYALFAFAVGAAFGALLRRRDEEAVGGATFPGRSPSPAGCPS